MNTEFNIPKEQQARFNSQKAIENRQIRIFLSSTFSDMQEERDALVKTFNSLKVEANKRNVTLSVVDLRWGVTEEEARTGKVISVCFNEIEHSHPFFIGMLGSRYGYAPDLSELDKNPELKERYPWIEEAIKERLSITEMEILYGVLCNDNTIDAAFYFRKSDTPDDNPKLTALKDKITAQQRFPKTYYTSVDDLCEKVKKAVRQMLDTHFPEVESTPLDRERTSQRAYINSCHDNYVKRQSDFDRLNEFVNSNDRNLVVTGDSGMGKSALLANWIKENSNNEKYNLIYHFIGNSLSASNSYSSILRHLCDEIYDLYGIVKDPNDNKIEDEARNAFIEVRNQKKPLVIVIDAINQVLNFSKEKQLTWLPEANDKIKFIFSTLEGDETMEVFERQGYPIFKIVPLDLKSRITFAMTYLKDVGKRLTEAQLNRIFNDKENENTLVLKTLLDELICFGSYEKIDERIDYYLNTTSIPDFYDRVLRRLENDYSNGQDLVRHTLSLIALSEKGMSEDELLAITGYRKIDWNLFYCAINNHLVEKGGLISFSHQYMLQAVQQRYLKGHDMTAFRKEIVDYCEKTWQTVTDWTMAERIITERAYQYYMLKDWDHLYDTLVDKYAFKVYENNIYLFVTYWRTLLNVDASKYSLSGYLNLSFAEDVAASYYLNLANFARTYFSDYNLSMQFLERCLNDQHVEKDPNTKVRVYIDMAYSCMRLPSKQKESISYYLEALNIAKQNSETENSQIADIYNSMGLYYGRLIPMPGMYSKTKQYLLKAMEINENIYGLEHPKTAISYTEIGRFLYQSRGKNEKALEYYFKALDIETKAFGTNCVNVTALYKLIGWSYYKTHNYEKSLEYFTKAYKQMVIIAGEDSQSVQDLKVMMEKAASKTGNKRPWLNRIFGS